MGARVTLTFLFTDIEGSTRLWEEAPDAARSAVERHDAIVRAAVAAHGGAIVKGTGDGFLASFPTAAEGLLAATAAQRALLGEIWRLPDGRKLRARMGLHTGEAELRDGDYFGSAVNRAARLMSIAAGGQTVVSGVTAALVDQQ